MDVVTGAKLWLLFKPIRRIKKRLNKRRVRRGMPPLKIGQEEAEIMRYNKLWVVLVGAVITFASRWFPGLEDANAEAVVEAAVLLLTALGVWAVPNKPKNS